MNGQAVTYSDNHCPADMSGLSGTQNHLTTDILGGKDREVFPQMSGSVMGGHSAQKKSINGGIISHAKVMA